MKLPCLYWLSTSVVVAKADASEAHRHSFRTEDRPVHRLWFPPGANTEEVSDVRNATFSQLIDHSDPTIGTFEQWYMYDTTYYGGGGSPVVLFTPGEVNASGYSDFLSKKRTTGVLAEQIGAAVIVLEHRYWGTSTPFTDLTTANLTYLTLENAIHDLTNFARNVHLPFDPAGSSNAQTAPWVLIGGSYAGSLAAWTENLLPGTFWAYHCSSASVQAISDYWSWFVPVQEGMPKNCSKDVSRVIEHMDNILTTGSPSEVHDLKAMFGLESIEHNDDFMRTLESGPWLWQGNQFNETSGFYTWCDFVENAVNETDPAKLPDEQGVGLDKALKGYARWAKDHYLPDFGKQVYGYFDGGLNTECFNTYNTSNPIFTDITLGNTAKRQWTWMTCNEPFGFWQTGAPKGQPTLASRLVNAEYWIRQCSLFFPMGPNGETFGLNKGRSEADVNTHTGGWKIKNSTRLQYTNGEYDPWREAGVSSDLRPGGPLESTPETPVRIVPGGFHTSDLITENGVVNKECQAVIDANVRQLVEWVNGWPSYYGAQNGRWEVNDQINLGRAL